MGKFFGTLAAGLILPLALVSAPATAQDAPPEEDWEAISAELGAAFVVEPLTAQQEARLPQARALIARIMPPGTMQEMFGGMFGGMLGPLMEAEAGDPASVVSARFGYNMTSTEDAAAEVAVILDPAWAERERREMEAMPVVIGRMMAAIEPAMRGAMSELYAVHFTSEELSGIDAFFSTPIGASYARKSFSMTSDPRLAASMMQAMPTMFGSAASIEAEMAALMADLPPERGYDDLNTNERKRLAQLLGIPQDDLQYYFEDAALDAADPAAKAGGE